MFLSLVVSRSLLKSITSMLSELFIALINSKLVHPDKGVQVHVLMKVKYYHAVTFTKSQLSKYGRTGS